MHSDITILKSGNCVQSRQYQGVFMQVIYEHDASRILRTELASGSALDNLEFGLYPAWHYVIDGTIVLRTANQSADLTPGDSVVLSHGQPYTIINRVSSRAVILTLSARSGTDWMPMRESRDFLEIFQRFSGKVWQGLTRLRTIDFRFKKIW